MVDVILLWLIGSAQDLFQRLGIQATIQNCYKNVREEYLANLCNFRQEAIWRCSPKDQGCTA